MRALLGSILASFAFVAAAERGPGSVIEELQKLGWQRGPGEATIAGKAKIRIPGGFAFLDETGTRRFLELMGNQPQDGRTLFAPANLDWFALFSFDAVGYVRDDGSIGADAMLDALRRGEAQANEERMRRGLEPTHVEGWLVAPHYDPGARRLAWGLRVRDERGGLQASYTSRLLGRRGVMNAVLVSAPQTLGLALNEFNGVLGGFRFVAGEQYADFRAGDRLADAGLSELVVGAPAAAKAGLLESLGKFLWVVVAGAAIGGWALFKMLFGRKEAPPAGPGSENLT